MSTNRRSKRLHHGRRTLLVAAGLLIVGAGLQFDLVEMANAADESKPQLMFVQTAEDLKVDAAASTFRLVNVNQQTLFFSDRPVRIAGHIRMATYLEDWKSGEDNFGEDPPNATLSVYEPGQANNTVVAIEITNPVIDGADLIYSYGILDGNMPEGGGSTTLFIDWLRARPGVGRGGVGGVGVGVGGVARRTVRRCAVGVVC